MQWLHRAVEWNLSGRLGHQFISSVPAGVVTELECGEGVSRAPRVHLGDNNGLY